MKILISSELSNAIKKLPTEDMVSFVERVNELEKLNKKEILSSPNLIELFKSQDATFYAYNIHKSIYVVFAFQKKSIVLLDRIKLINKNDIESLVYTSEESST